MKPNWWMIRKAAAITFVSFSLGACQSLSRLPDGQMSAMDADSNQLRGQLAVREILMPSPPIYGPVKNCSFWETNQPYGGTPVRVQAEISIKPTRKGERLLVIGHAQGKVSTALIDRNGRLYDFNQVDVLTGQRVNADTYEQYAERKLEAAVQKNPELKNPHTINDFSVSLPEYLGTPKYIGDVAAVVRSGNGDIWARYIYKGMTTYRGVDAAVFDLVRMFPDSPESGPVVVGFDIVGTSNMMPLTVVMNAGTKMRDDQIACER